MSCGCVYASNDTTSDNKEITKENEVELNSRIYQKRNWAESGIKVAVNDENINFSDVKPALDINTERTYVPVRFLAEQLGAQVDWDEKHQVVIIRNKYIEGSDTDLIHYLKIGSNKYIVAQYKDSDIMAIDNIQQSMSKNALRIRAYYLPEDVTPVIKDNRTMLPFRYVAELMGAQVYYREDTHTAHCVKRDMSSYVIDGWGFPIFSTLVGDVFIEELNNYKKNHQWDDGYYTNQKDAIYNGSYSDMMVWAGFDQTTHPEQVEYFRINSDKYYDGIGGLHFYSWDRYKDVATTPPEDFHVGAWYQYTQTYLKGTKYTEVDSRGQTKYFTSYLENATQAAHPTYAAQTKNNERLDKSKEVYNELTQKWGINIQKEKNVTMDNITWQEVPGPLNGEYRNITLIDNWTYKLMIRPVIASWDSSRSHKSALLGSDKVGFAMVGKFAYYCSNSI